WATSAITFFCSPPSSKSISTAKRISGNSPGGNSMSTTGPATLTMRPLPVLSAIVNCSSLVSDLLGQRLGAADDLGDGGGDLGLPCPVGADGQDPDEFLGIFGGGFHRSPPGGMFRCRRFQQHAEDRRLDVTGKQPVQDLGRRRLVFVGDGRAFAL